MSWIAWVLMMVSLWISPGKGQTQDKILSQAVDCLREATQHIIVPEKFDCILNAQNFPDPMTRCIIFLKNGERRATPLGKRQLQTLTKDGDALLYISPWHTQRKLQLFVKQGTGCTKTTANTECRAVYLNTTTMCANLAYEGNNCAKLSPDIQDRYIVNLSAPETHCFNCNNPVKKPDIKHNLHLFTNSTDEEELKPAQAIEAMNKLSDFAKSMAEHSAEVNIGNGVSGIIVKEHQATDIKQVSLAFAASSGTPNIIDEETDLHTFSTSVSMPKQAFEKALSSNISAPFVTVCIFHNMTKDEKNSTLVGDEIVAIEMGTTVANLTDKIGISFLNIQYEGIPSCHSWNGQGSKPKWTDAGCVTVAYGDNITCQCSHLTFFAILLTPLNETVSSSDLKKLTVITQVGCALSMLFLAVVLFMHFLLRRSKAIDSITLLIHLVVAIFFLDLTFLVNHHVESLGNSVGCKIMAAVMHYFLLATFMWFATQAFHLCLQLTVAGQVNIRHYVLRVSLGSWGLPLVVVVVLLSTGRYGAQDINTSDTDETVAMCWITDSIVHWVVNIGCYALVFLFTFTTFIIIFTLLIRHKKANTGSDDVKRNSTSVMVVFGLCSILGISWGFVFFAYGVLRIPAYYIFSVLSSFQGFFLFVYYYYHARHSAEIYDSSSDRAANTGTTIADKVS